MGVLIKLLNMNFFLLISFAAAAMAGPMPQEIPAEPYIHEEVPYVHEDIPAEPYIHVEIPAEPYVYEEFASPVAAPAVQPTAYAGVPLVGVPQAGVSEAVVPWNGECVNYLGETVKCI